MNKLFKFSACLFMAMIGAACITALNAQIPSYVPTSGLVAWYPFTGNANDSSGNGHNGTTFGTTLTTDRFGHANSAYHFNGTGNYIQVPNNAAFNLQDAMTISIWIYAANVTMAQRIIDKTTGGFNDSWLLDLSPEITNLNEVRCIAGGTNIPFSTPVITLNNTWYHVAVTYDLVNVKFYINGTLNNTVPLSTVTPANSNPVGIGVASDITDFFGGKLDDIGIWNRPLTPCEINELYTATVPNAGPITGPTVICAGSATTLADTATGGVWSSTAPAIATAGAGGLITAVAAGTATINYTVSTDCGIAVSATTVTVNPLPSPAIINSGLTLSTSSPFVSYQWMIGGAPITGATNAAYNVVLNGAYAVEVTDSYGCSGTSGVTIIANVSTQNITAAGEDDLSVYPNPNNGSFTLLLSSAIEQRATVIITNITGETIKMIMVWSNKAGDVVLPPTPGVYLVSLVTDNGAYKATRGLVIR